MKTTLRFVIPLLISLLLSACGAIPTLPPLDSTVAFKTPRYTLEPHLVTATSQPVMPTKTPLPTTATPRFSATPTAVPATKTPYYSSTPQATGTPAHTPTKTATPPPTLTRTPQPSPTATAVPYALQLLNPYYLPNFTHQDAGCGWLGVAGQVFSREGQVQKQIVVKAGGTLSGAPLIESMTLPLAEPEVDLAYGPGGFELTLANQVAATEGKIWIQLYSLAGYPLSEKVYLVTYNDCQKNLILINFIEK